MYISIEKVTMGDVMRILVAGGAGFIGSNLIKRILNDSTDIVVVDNLSTGTIENILPFINLSNFRFYNIDIGVMNSLDFLSKEKFDYIYNFACPANPPYCFSHSLDVINVNFFGTLQLAELAIKSNAILFQASTSEVYGDPKCDSQNETYLGNVNPFGVRACYDEGKRCAETMLYDYKRMHNLDVRIVRIFNTYGPNMSLDDGRVMVQFFKKALSNEPIIIYGSGNQTRSFCYITDLIDGIVELMSLSECPSSPVNLGTDEEFTIKEIAEKIINLTSSKSLITYSDGTPDDPQKRKPCLDYAKKLLSWNPKVNINDGLRMCKEYFESKVNPQGLQS